MGFNTVYKSLQELFPQIDSRVLRAVAIEHSKDPDAAVEAVLEEIIPFFTERSRPSSPLAVSSPAGTSQEVQVHYDNVVERQQSRLDVLVEQADAFYDVSDDNHDTESKLSETVSAQESHIVSSADLHSHCDNVMLDQSSTSTLTIEVSEAPRTEGTNFVSESTQSYPVTLCENISGLNLEDHQSLGVMLDESPTSTLTIEVSEAPRTEGTISVSESTQSYPVTLCENISGLNLEDHQSLGVGESLNIEQKHEDPVNWIVNDLVVDTSEENGSIDGQDSLGKPASWTTTDDKNLLCIEQPETQGSAPEDIEAALCADDTLMISTTREVTGTNYECMISDIDATSEVVGTSYGGTLDSSLSKSSQTHIVDVIDNSIAAAKDNKKILFSAMESVINLMKELENKEQTAELAKKEAAMGGADTLKKVQELKKMLHRAKATNDMHAGEVYGEKAILTTELRELQSRVLSLSDEKDKSLAVLDEMRQTLQVRLAAAEDKIKDAEQERLVNEQMALVELKEQELIMAKVVSKSIMLKQQSEENTKLQELLLDRGHVLDVMQGELAVIYQDVRLLKENFDENVPFSKSVSSSQTSCKLASSGSSPRSSVREEETESRLGSESPVAVLTDLGNVPMNDLTALEFEPLTSDLTTSPDQNERENEASKDEHKALIDDGWDVLDQYS